MWSATVTNEKINDFVIDADLASPLRYVFNEYDAHVFKLHPMPSDSSVLPTRPVVVVAGVVRKRLSISFSIAVKRIHLQAIIPKSIPLTLCTKK